MKGKATCVLDDPTLRRVKQATLISSDLAYKGAKGRNDEMERMRMNISQDYGRGDARLTSFVYSKFLSHLL